jgi:uncharacterized protein YbjQ (UPF0145 family)
VAEPATSGVTPAGPEPAAPGAAHPEPPAAEARAATPDRPPAAGEPPAGAADPMSSAAGPADRSPAVEDEPRLGPLPRDPGGVSSERPAATARVPTAVANGHGAADAFGEPLSAVDLTAFGELPIEREVAMAIARSGGEPIDWWSIPPRGAEPPAPEQPLPIPAQAAAHESESVLLVTTEGVPGREVLDVHGDVLAVASWPAPGPSGRSVHEVARDRLAMAVLRRGGNALVGLRYGATGMIGGDVVAYGTAVTLAPVEKGAVAGPRRAGGSADR